jgi:hypothetical protein
MGQVEHPGEPGERPRGSLGDAADATSGEAGQIDEEVVSTSGESETGGGPVGEGGGGTSISYDAESAIQDIQDRRAGG